MCRHTAWLGEPRSLEELLLTPPYGLLHQSYAPRRQAYGRVNADGFGAGWYDPSRPAPARYRRAVPIWADASFASFAGVVRSGCLLGAVRSATAGTPRGEEACAPFRLDGVLLSHNGRVDVAAVAPLVDPLLLAQVGSTVDSAYVAALVLARLRAGLGLAQALAATVREVSAADPVARLNLLATDGACLAATAWGDTLVTLCTPEGVAVASEAADDSPWEPVPDRTLVAVVAGALTLEDL